MPASTKPSLDGHEEGVVKKIKATVTAVSLFLPWIIFAGLVFGPTLVPLLRVYIEKEKVFEQALRDIELNSEFRIRWPRGDLGRLPDDVKQNAEIKDLQRRTEGLEKFFPRQPKDTTR